MKAKARTRLATNPVQPTTFTGLDIPCEAARTDVHANRRRTDKELTLTKRDTSKPREARSDRRPRIRSVKKPLIEKGAAVNSSARRTGVQTSHNSFQAPRAGQRYSSLAVLHSSKRPEPTFPTRLATVLHEETSTYRARPSLDGSLQWCYCCDTILQAGSHSPLCVPCRREKRSMRQAAARRRAREEFTITRTDLEAIHSRVEALSSHLGKLTVAYNTGGDLRAELDKAMLGSKDLIKTLTQVLPRVD